MRSYGSAASYCYVDAPSLSLNFTLPSQFLAGDQYPLDESKNLQGSDPQLPQNVDNRWRKGEGEVGDVSVEWLCRRRSAGRAWGPMSILDN